MTSAQLATASKSTLLEYIAKLQVAEQEAKAQTQEAVQIANYFSSVILAIEQLLLNSPFVNKDGKFFKTLFWIMGNISTVKKLVEEIITQIKNWRSEVQKMVDRQKAAQTIDSTPAE